MEFLVIQCVAQTSLTLQRSCRVNLRRDIKDRRIADALWTPPRGTDSLSIRCLDTYCYLFRQLHIARKLFNIVPSSSNMWSCSQLSNTWAMTADLCGHGHKWRNRTGKWIDSKDRHRFAKLCFTTKGGMVLSRILKAIFALPALPVFRVPCTVCQITAILQSNTGVWFGRCGVAGSRFLQSRIARTKVASSRAIWP